MTNGTPAGWPVPRAAARAPAALAESRLFASRFLSDDDRRALLDATLPERTVKSGTDLAREGERTDMVYILAEGWACRYTTTRDGGRQLPAVLVPGDVGNLDTLLFDRLDYGVRLLTEASVVALPRDRALALAERRPGIARAFTWLAMVENTTLGKWAQSLGRRSSRESFAHLLCELAVRLGAGREGESSFAFPMTQELIGDALGLTSVHVNRTIQQLRNEGLITLANRTVTVPSMLLLRQVCGFDARYLHADRKLDAQPA